jgi:hypothetical protein
LGFTCVVDPNGPGRACQGTSSPGWSRSYLSFLVSPLHKVRTYKEYHSVCPSSELGLSQPLSRQRVFPSPQKQGGGGTLACGRGVGGSPNSDEGHTLWYSLYVRTLWSTLSAACCIGNALNFLYLVRKRAITFDVCRYSVPTVYHSHTEDGLAHSLDTKASRYMAV